MLAVQIGMSDWGVDVSKTKIIGGAVILVIVTAVTTMAGVCLLLGLDSRSAVGAVRLLSTIRYIQHNFVNDVDGNKIMTGAISGAMDSLGDPHSVYLDSKIYKELKTHTEGTFGGIGVVMGLKDKEVTVVSPIEGTPGSEAGIRTGDKIVKIDGVDTKDVALDQVAAKIRGEIGTKVVLTIHRDGEEDKDYELTRSNIEIKTVGSTMLEDNIGYIRIATFSEHTGQDLERAYRELEEQGVKAIVLDLRNNPGGLLDTSVEVSQFFVPKGKIVSIMKRDGTKEVHESHLAQVKYPVAVLINGGSASASEIVAGAIQDTGAGTIVGTKSYGKGSVQSVVPMYSGDALKLTVAKYYTPNDRCIDGIGIVPDVEVELELDGKVDNQLLKAVEILKEKI